MEMEHGALDLEPAEPEDSYAEAGCGGAEQGGL